MTRSESENVRTDKTSSHFTHAISFSSSLIQNSQKQQETSVVVVPTISAPNETTRTEKEEKEDEKEIEKEKAHDISISSNKSICEENDISKEEELILVSKESAHQTLLQDQILAAKVRSLDFLHHPATTSSILRTVKTKTKANFQFLTVINIQQRGIRDISPLVVASATLRLVNLSENCIKKLPKASFWSEFDALELLFLDQNVI